MITTCSEEKNKRSSKKVLKTIKRYCTYHKNKDHVEFHSHKIPTPSRTFEPMHPMIVVSIPTNVYTQHLHFQLDCSLLQILH